MSENHPYYDSEKRRNWQIIMYKFIVVFALFLIVVILVTVIRYEKQNLIPVWVQYEVKVVDKDKVIFYKSHDVSDSLVFRCNTDIFLGTQAIEKLEYRLP